MATLPDFDMDDMSDQMDDMELVSILRSHEAQAIGYQPGGGDEISAQQERAINYYYGIMTDTPSQEGCSGVVDWTVQTVIDNGMSAILKPFVGSDETVRFAPRGPEDQEQADQATEYVNYVFNVDNPGFRIMYDWAKDGLLTKLGVVKAWWEADSKVESQDVPIENEIHAQMLRQHPEYMGEQNGVATVGRMVEGGKIRVENIPPEEFRISRFSRSVATAIYTAHCPSNLTRSDVYAMGFDPEIVEALPAGTDLQNTTRQARYQDENAADAGDISVHSSQDIIALRDEYVRIDYDGDGLAELRRVVRVEDIVLMNEEAEESPFAAWCPIPMPH